MTQDLSTPQFLLCLSVGAYPASLDAGRPYRVIPDELAATKGFVRVIDESGEDYLYPRKLFALIDLPSPTVEAISTLDLTRLRLHVQGSKKSKSPAAIMMTMGFRRFSMTRVSPGRTQVANALGSPPLKRS